MLLEEKAMFNKINTIHNIKKLILYKGYNKCFQFYLVIIDLTIN